MKDRRTCRRYTRRAWRHTFGMLIAVILTSPLTVQAQPIWEENFDSYAPFSTIAGQGTWETWDASTDPAVNATVDDSQASSIPNSLFIGGTADIVNQFSGVTSGSWAFTAWVWVDAAQTGEAHLILLNDYQHLGPYNWSVQLGFDATAGIVSDDGGSAGGPGVGVTAPLITDAWVEIRVEIDLDANLHSIYYDGQPLRVGEIYSGGAIAIACLDLYSASSSGVYFDDLSLEQLPCSSPSSLVCSNDCGSDEANLSWVLAATSTYDSVEVLIDGTSVAMLPGDATDYVATGLSDGSHLVEVIASCSGTSFTVSCNLVTVVTPPTHAIWAGEEASQIDSVAAVDAALDGLGIDALIATEIGFVSCMEPGSIVFCCMGSFPSNRAITADEGQLLVDAITNGVHVHLEGGDIWGFDAATALAGYDGIADGILDGDDTLVGMIGFDSGPALMSGLDAVYNQDQAASDWTDQLIVTDMDLAGPNAGVIWADDTTGGGTGYTVGVFYATDAPLGRVLSQSFEFGGYGGDPEVMMMRELEAFAGTIVILDEFRRGDSNGDGGLDISDAVFTLGSLFVPGSPSSPCTDAADANDDGGVDISDAVFSLGALFVPGSATPPAPGSLDCGPDPTMDTLECDTYVCP